MQGPYMDLVKQLSYKNIVNLKSVADTDLAINKIIKNKIKYNYFFSDYKKILKDDEIDLILVLTSMKEHASISKEALLSNKHVLVEKPMATNMKDLKDLMSIANKTKKYLIAAPFVILSPVYQAMHHEVKKKSIGNISLARARCSSAVAVLPAGSAFLLLLLLSCFATSSSNSKSLQIRS